jgi:hypothetical protein
MQMLKANNFTRSKAHVALLSYQKEMFLDLSQLSKSCLSYLQLLEMFSTPFKG